jgi:hypothetical protein
MNQSSFRGGDTAYGNELRDAQSSAPQLRIERGASLN